MNLNLKFEGLKEIYHGNLHASKLPTTKQGLKCLTMSKPYGDGRHKGKWI